MLIKEESNKNYVDVWGNIHYFNNETRLYVQYKDGTTAHFNKNGGVWKTTYDGHNKINFSNLKDIVKAAILNYNVNSGVSLETHITNVILDKYKI